MHHELFEVLTREHKRWWQCLSRCRNYDTHGHKFPMFSWCNLANLFQAFGAITFGTFWTVVTPVSSRLKSLSPEAPIFSRQSCRMLKNAPTVALLKAVARTREVASGCRIANVSCLRRKSKEPLTPCNLFLCPCSWHFDPIKKCHFISQSANILCS